MIVIATPREESESIFLRFKIDAITRRKGKDRDGANKYIASVQAERRCQQHIVLCFFPVSLVWRGHSWNGGGASLFLVDGHINACGVSRSQKIYKLAALGKRAL